MFGQILYVQWKWARMVVLVGVFASFALPILSIQKWTGEQGTFDVKLQMLGLEQVGIVYPLLAASLGLALAMTGWMEDHRGRHVYALSLPVPRWYYVLLKLGAGVVLLTIPTAALWVGALLASKFATVPLGLHVYPTGLMLRFALATLVAYTAFFAISAGTNRAAGVVLGGIAAVAATQVLFLGANMDIDIVTPILERLFSWPSPLEIFGGRWVLIDV